MKNIKEGYLLIILILLSNCNLLKNTPKDEFLEGFYFHKINGGKKKVYFHVEEQPWYIFPELKPDDEKPVDTSKVITLNAYVHKHKVKRQLVLSRSGLDIDLMTIPVKYRPSRANVPAQLNAGINGELFLGYRKDLYMIDFSTNPLGKPDENINQLGLSVGAFTGLGNTFVSPTNTNNILDQEYDGIVWNKGLAAIFAVNGLTLGINLGWDTLLDNNKDIWIYQGKTWLGVGLGFNLN